MAHIDNGLLELPGDTKNANIVKEVVLDQLLRDNLITKEQFLEYTENWQVIVIKRSWFKKWWDKYASGTADNYVYNIVKFNK